MIVCNFLVLAIVLCYKAKAKPPDKKPVVYTTVKDNNLVEVIRKDLTRNNDDYKEITQEKRVLNINQVDAIFRKKPKLRPEAANVKKGGYRRKNGKSDEEYVYGDTTNIFRDAGLVFKNYTNKSQVVFMKNKPQKITIHRNQSKFDKLKKIILPTIKTFTFIPSTKDLRLEKNQNVIPKFVKKDKIDKFKHFMKKNEGLLKNFVSNKLETQTKQTGIRQFSISKENYEMVKPIIRHDKMKKNNRHEDKNDGKLPSPELLDMAPAVGGRIHRQREKGRLCHRHVLMPEGPKYDSRGRWYVPAHELVATRPYPETKRPKLLLPRCCNCCKKSVLGCE